MPHLLLDGAASGPKPRSAAPRLLGRATTVLPWLLGGIVFPALLSGCSDDDTAGTPSAGRHVVVLFTSDEHSHLFAFSPELDDDPKATAPGKGELLGGVARRATVLARERAAAEAAGKPTLTVSAGDNQMGCLPHVAFETASIDWGTMAALGYDVTTFGNHEFDFGPGALARSIQAAQKGSGMPPVVASNLHFSDKDAADDDLAALYSDDEASDAPVHPWRVVTMDNGVKVGVFGFVGVNAEHVAPNKTPVQFSAVGLTAKQEGDPAAVLPQLYADLQPVVDALRSVGKADLVVALSHAGLRDTTSDAAIETGEDYLIAANVTGIDLIVSGHAHDGNPKPIVVPNAKSGKETLVLNAGSFGRLIGRVDFTVGGAGAPTWDPATQALLPVDDTTLPDPEQAKATDALVESIETAGGTAGSSFLESTLSSVLGSPIADDAGKPGDLYFHEVGKTAFDVTDTHSLIFLSADAMLAAGDELGAAADMGLESAGNIRGVIKKGKTGVISAADAFNIVPLGRSPVDGTVGYPLARAYLSSLELRGVFEFALTLGPTSSDYDLGQAGVRVEYDGSRPLVEKLGDLFADGKGQVMKILLDTDHTDGFEQFDEVIYDRAGKIDLPGPYAVITSSYIAQFAADVGVTLKDKDSNTITLAETIVHRSGTTEAKQVEAFMGFLHAQPNGTLASLYDASSASKASRLVCTTGCK